MKTYVITLSKKFPKGHRKEGKPTFFKEQLQNALLADAGVSACDCCKYETRNCGLAGTRQRSFTKSCTQSGRTMTYGRNALKRLNGARLAYLFGSGRTNLTAVHRLKLLG